MCLIFLNKTFDCFAKPWRNFVAEDRNFFIHISIEKGTIPIKGSNCPSDKFNIWLFIVSDFSRGWWWVTYL